MKLGGVAPKPNAFVSMADASREVRCTAEKFQLLTTFEKISERLGGSL